MVIHVKSFSVIFLCQTNLECTICRYAAYIPQQLVSDFDVKSATFPANTNSVFTETSLRVFGVRGRPNILRLMAVITGVVKMETIKKRVG